MGTKERHVGETALRDAESVLKDVQELGQLTQELAFIASRLKSHLEAAQAILAKGLNRSNEIWYNQHIRAITRLCKQYEKLRGRRP